MCIKVDYAEATGTHNTQNANFVERLYSEKVPAQIDDPKCRSTIYGKPILLFNQADSSSDPVFYGKSNMNYDKGSEYVFGFTDKYDVECWEFKNNTSDACNFLGPVPEIWVDDFEARYPEETTEIGRFREMHNWVVSTKDNLDKFKMEFEDHFDMHFSLIYYVYTFFALMVDQRAKNMFLTYWGKTDKWYPYFYDNDTSFGINNEGQLIYDYFHEDTDQLDGANVYNGQNSVLWSNFRNAFPDEIKATYQDLRSTGVLNYDELIDQFITKGSDKWSESIYNEDADFKYISMLYSDNDATNLWQVRGTGEEHFRYFVENRLNYCDSKWYAADYADDYILLRIYTPQDENGNPRTDLAVAANADITLIPFSHMYAGVRYKANGTLQQERVEANEVVTFEAPNETFNNTETAIYGASQLSSLVDLSPLYCGGINVSKATKLTELIIGNGTEGYSNPNLIDLSVGTNELLKVINIQNCPNLTDPLALSGCPNIEEIYAAGSGITGVELANSGYLKTIELPATIANLTLKNQLYIESLTLEGYDAIKTINIENCPTVASLDILSAATNVERVRLTNVDWAYDTVEDVLALSERNLAGIDENGNNTDKMWIDGKCHIKTLTGADYLKVKEAFPYMTITYDNLTAVLTYMSEDGSEKLHEETVYNGGDGSAIVADSDNLIDKSECVDGVSMPNGMKITHGSWLVTPFIEIDTTSKYYTNISKFVSDGSTQYSQQLFLYDENKSSWTINTLASYHSYGTMHELDISSVSLSNGNSIKYVRIVFHVLNDTPYFGKSGVITSGDIVTPTKPSTAQYDFTFGGWSLSPNSEPNENALKNVEADRTVYVAFTKSLRKYTVKFYNGTTLLETKTVEYGSDATYTGATPVHPTAPDDCEFRAWKPEPTNIQGDTNCYAQWYDRREITDSWETIAAAVVDGTATEKYAIGAFKMLDIGVKDLPYDFEQSSAVIYNDEIHILGSSASAYRTSHYKWTGTEWVEVSTLPYEFYYGSAVVYNNEIHIFGGSSSSTARTKHYKWNGSSWTSVSTLPYKFSEGIAIVYNNEIHIMSSVESSNYTSHYKWTGSEWTEVGVLPYNLYTASAVIYNNELHVLGSYDSNHDTSHYKWNGSTWTSVSTLPQKLSNGHALVVGTDIYMIQWDEFYKYDGTSWSTVPEVPANVYEGCSVVLDGVIYVMGSSISENRKVFFSYTPETETWSKVGITESIPMEVIAHNHDELASGYKWEGISKQTNTPQYGCAVTYQNEVHALGGNSGSSYTQHIKWDDTNSTWVTVSALPYQFRSGCAVILNDEIHILGSYQTTNKTEHYKWNATDGWVSVSTLPYRFYCSSAVVLNNEIHILGSYDSSSRKYHYKWNGTEWASVSTLPYNFYYGSAVVYNGEIHIFSGSGSSTGHYKWDGSAWTSVSTLPYNLQYGVATIINNKIHIFGGSGNETGHYKWDGTEWTSMTTLPGNFDNYPLAVCNGTPYIFISTSCYKLAGARWENSYSGRYDSVAVVYNNEIHRMQGTAHHKWDGTTTTSKVSTVPCDVYGGNVLVYNGDIHLLKRNSTTSYHGKWNPTDGWIEVSTIPISSECNACVYDGYIHLVGKSSKEHYKWNETDGWIEVGEANSTANAAGLVVYNDELHMLGPNWNHSIWNETDGWVTVANLPEVCYPANGSVYAFIVNKELQFIHGSKHYKWDGTTWSKASTLPHSINRSAIVVFRGKIHIMGSGSSGHYECGYVLTNPRATLTFFCKNLPSKTFFWGKDPGNYSGHYAKCGWIGSTVRSKVNSTMLESFPEELQNVISSVCKLSNSLAQGGMTRTEDKIWLPSLDEMGLVGEDSYHLLGQGDAYPIFTDNVSRRRSIVGSEDYVRYPLRSSSEYHGNQVLTISTSGARDSNCHAGNATTNVPIGFCI